MEKKYWKSLEELNSSPEKDYLEDHKNVDRNEILELVEGETTGISSSRRDFLKLCGFSIASTALIAGCERPVQKAIPYFIQPEEIIPGQSNYYATTFFDGDDYGSILAKVRDGRPIKIEGNNLSLISQGRASARLQASVLDLYDTSRFSYPVEDAKEIPWEEADRKIIAALQSADVTNGKTVVLTGTVISPSTRQIINDFINAHPGSEWIQYDPLSFSATLEANRLCFGRRVVPLFHFDRAELIVSFGCDFLGTWLMPVTFAWQYASGRTVSGSLSEMSRHVQFESAMSLTGANADTRVQIRPSQLHVLLMYLHDKLQGLSPSAPAGFEDILNELADELLAKAGRSLIVCGYNDLHAQVAVNAINNLLGNYGNTIDLNTGVLLRQGDDEAVQSLIGEMNQGRISALLVHGVNPVFDHPQGVNFAAGMDNVPLKISLSGKPDETSALCNFICPDNHYLESWGDAEPVSGQYSLQQPVIRPLGNTRQMQESLLIWMGLDGDYAGLLKNFWNNNILSAGGQPGNDLWNVTLQKGVWETETESASQPAFDPSFFENMQPATQAEPGIEFELTQSIAMGSGKHANNPWLQELPDPVAKVTWDNFLSISIADAQARSLETGDIVQLNGILAIPVIVQPGQAPGTVSAAIGYGHTAGGKVAIGTGVNVLPLAAYADGAISYHVTLTSLEKTGRKHKLAFTQSHHSMEGRSIVRETTLSQYRENPSSGNEIREDILSHMYSLYEEVEFKGLHWAMAIDLSKCTGCSSCVLACQAENNIPVIGKEEVYRRRIMHWIRIDRYYSGDAANPDVHFMPVNCQHCDNAPCENVCPVAATNHSDEGINQMAYVRCIGTKYCINNCPYKVRRFNWFAYARSGEYNDYMDDNVGRLVLNPDVAVRERGIVEKCSFCIQRIQSAKIQAKAEGRPLGSDEVVPACAQTCPSNAIVFGNIADKGSRIYELFQDKRNYHLLEELHTLPSVGYLTKVKNKQS